MPCKKALPGAVTFTVQPKARFANGYNAAKKLVGWVALSTDVVKVPAYSGQPLVTLIGMNRKGVITGAQVLKHSEPILLVGIPEKVLHDFSNFYIGKKATTYVVVGRSTKGAESVDVISGATVTALAQNKTILETARAVGIATGVIKISQMSPGSFVKAKEKWSWKEMQRRGVWGRLSVTEKQMEVPNPSGMFVDLWYTIADAPQVGRSLLGDRTYEYLKKSCKPGEHLLVVLGNGSNSFKGSAFVRGGIFDRVRLEQGLREVVFRDTDYHNISRVEAKGAPEFKEGAVFITRGAPLNPGASYRMVFLGSIYDGKGAYHRSFRQFSSTHTLPSSVYKLKHGRSDTSITAQAWKNRQTDVFILSVFLLMVMGIFLARKVSFRDLKYLRILHVSVMLVSVIMVGFVMHAQPSITQVLTLFDTTVKGWNWTLFLSEPLLFVSWIFIAIVSLVWGRGVFCGWVCPYGALTELLFKLGRFLKIPELELPDHIHKWARLFRYFVFFGLIPVFLVSSVWGEKLAELEPFKSTFFVYAWNRHWGFFAWWLLLLVIALTTFRPFCRYLCPLGAGLALFGSFRLSGPKRRSFCSSCKICTKTCEPKAIRDDGTIDSRECLSCMECESNYLNEQVCPPLVGRAKLTALKAPTEEDKKKLARILEQIKDV